MHLLIRFGDYGEILQAGDTHAMPMHLKHTIDALEAGEVIDVFCRPREDYMA